MQRKEVLSVKRNEEKKERGSRKRGAGREGGKGEGDDTGCIVVQL